MNGEVVPARGEVSEREDLLDGRVRVAIEGEAGNWFLEAALGWRRARDGAIALDAADSYLTLTSDGGELIAGAEAGTVAVDPDTALALVEVRFAVEQAAGDLAGLGDALSGQFRVGAEEWSGELRLP